MPPWLRQLWYNTVKVGMFAAYTGLLSERFIGGRNIPKSGPVLIVANHQFFCPDSFHENGLNKIERRNIRELFSERNAQQVLNTLFFYEVDALFKSIEQFQLGIVGI